MALHGQLARKGRDNILALEHVKAWKKFSETSL
jgi:hypothetical protein